MELITQNQITLGISIVLFIFSAVNFWNTRKADVKTDTEGIIKTNIKLDNLCSNMNETRVDLKGLVESTRHVSEEQIRLSQEVKAMWKRLDENRDRIEQLYKVVDVYKVREEKTS